MPRSLPAGFSLTELMVALVVIGILTAIALPNYDTYVRRSRRADARTSLSGMAQQLERCFSRFGSYDHADCGVGDGPFGSGAGFYRLSIAHRTATTYTLTAEPQHAQLRDRECGAFVLDHLGRTSVSGAQGSECWSR